MFAKQQKEAAQQSQEQVSSLYVNMMANNNLNTHTNIEKVNTNKVATPLPTSSQNNSEGQFVSFDSFNNIGVVMNLDRIQIEPSKVVFKGKKIDRNNTSNKNLPGYSSLDIKTPNLHSFKNNNNNTYNNLNKSSSNDNIILTNHNHNINKSTFTFNPNSNPSNLIIPNTLDTLNNTLSTFFLDGQKRLIKKADNE